MQGIGGVLYEHMPSDDNGNPPASTFLPLGIRVETFHVGPWNMIDLIEAAGA